MTIVMGTTAYLLKQVPARWLHLGATLAFICGCIICALTSSFPLMLAGRIVQGIATGFFTPIMFQLIFTQVPKQKLGLMTGFAGTIISFAPALGPTYEGLVVSAAKLADDLMAPFAPGFSQLNQRSGLHPQPGKRVKGKI
ncbi:MFS transporter [Lactobacillus delbrueckii subsp. lactis]|nr:MFS transporter [Lactobacillus delbrueckii subsp. lactis]MCD5548798.1 MFS transporter [Lactobacillus delbrueckii subsp. lactis]